MRPIACVTGASGFIGRRLVLELIGAGYTVRVLSRKPLYSYPAEVSFFRGDLCGAGDILSDFVDEADVLLHCAGELQNPDQIYPVNVDGTRRLIDVARGRVRRWVQLSSIGVYGQPREGRVDESTLVNPSNLYERSKAVADQLLLEAAANNAFQLTILRPSNVYGVGMQSTYLDNLRRMVRNGLFFFIGPPGASATFVHVVDVVRALLLCADKPQAAGRTYNLSGNNTFEYLVDCVAQAEGVSSPVRRLSFSVMRVIALTLGRIPGFPLTPVRFHSMTTRIYYDSSRIASELGYLPLIDLPSGIAKLYRDSGKLRRSV